ncbi:MAG: phosphoribosylformylglycinamidine synthase subunit PurS [Bacteroidetes bacterium]|nr:phosphoribosylformylglycinamidine synthase subunit PurS [Bacteroidota bacterium]
MNYKTTVEVILRSTILDVQGKAVENAIHSLGEKEISNVRVGKKITFNVAAENNSNAEIIVKSICDKLLANPIMEDFTFKIEQITNGLEN